MSRFPSSRITRKQPSATPTINIRTSFPQTLTDTMDRAAQCSLYEQYLFGCRDTIRYHLVRQVPCSGKSLLASYRNAAESWRAGHEFDAARFNFQHFPSAIACALCEQFYAREYKPDVIGGTIASMMLPNDVLDLVGKELSARLLTLIQQEVPLPRTPPVVPNSKYAHLSVPIRNTMLIHAWAGKDLKHPIIPRIANMIAILYDI